MGDAGWRGAKGKNWYNCNSIINVIIFKKEFKFDSKEKNSVEKRGVKSISSQIRPQSCHLDLRIWKH